MDLAAAAGMPPGGGFRNRQFVLLGPTRPLWGCSCGCDDNFASRVVCCGCGREAPEPIRNRAYAAHHKLLVAQCKESPSGVTEAQRQQPRRPSRGRADADGWVEAGGRRSSAAALNRAQADPKPPWKQPVSQEAAPPAQASGPAGAGAPGDVDAGTSTLEFLKLQRSMLEKLPSSGVCLAPDVIQVMQAAVEDGISKCRAASKSPEALFRDVQAKIDHKRKTVAKAAEGVKDLEADVARLQERLAAAKADLANKQAALSRLESEKKPLLLAMQASQRDPAEPIRVENVLAQVVTFPKGFSEDPGIQMLLQQASSVLQSVVDKARELSAVQLTAQQADCTPADLCMDDVGADRGAVGCGPQAQAASAGARPSTGSGPTSPWCSEKEFLDSLDDEAWDAFSALVGSDSVRSDPLQRAAVFQQVYGFFQDHAGKRRKACG